MQLVIFIPVSGTSKVLKLILANCLFERVAGVDFRSDCTAYELVTASPKQSVLRILQSGGTEQLQGITPLQGIRHL
jgi:hypothetical protein